MKLNYTFTLLFSVTSLFAFSVAPSGNDYLKLIGQSVLNPTLAKMVTDIEFGQHNSSFDRGTNTYELNAFSKGMKLLFNQNFVLKEIHFYDSGYLYSRFKGELPMNIALKMNQAYFVERFTNFEVDSANQFLFRGSFANGEVRVYMKGQHIELVRFTGNADYIALQDQQQMQYWGMRVIPDGKCLTGNCYTGNGKMKWSNSLVYEGNWDFGIPNKAGAMSDSLGFTYSGDYRLGFLWGEGRLTIPGQYTYKGQFLLGKRYGQGEIRYTNGSRYVGDWQSDLMHGKGHYYYSESYHFKGDFADNQFNGKGILTTPDGYIECGFKDGKPHGKGKQVATATNASLTGSWVNGKKEGLFDAYNPLLGDFKVEFENDIEIRKLREE